MPEDWDRHGPWRFSNFSSLFDIHYWFQVTSVCNLNWIILVQECVKRWVILLSCLKFLVVKKLFSEMFRHGGVVKIYKWFWLTYCFHLHSLFSSLANSPILNTEEVFSSENVGKLLPDYISYLKITLLTTIALLTSNLAPRVLLYNLYEVMRETFLYFT